MTKYLWVFLIVFLTHVETVYAVPAPPSPSCGVESSVVTLKPKVTIKVNALLSESGDTRYAKCADLYTVGKEVEIELVSDNLPKLEVGMKIQTTLQYSGDERSHGTNASNVVVVDSPTNQTKVSSWWEKFINSIMNFVKWKKG